MCFHFYNLPEFSLNHLLSNWSTKKVSNFPKVTQLVSGKLWFKPRQSGFRAHMLWCFTTPTPQKTKYTLISSVFSLPGRKKVETTSILEKAACGSRLRADDSNHSFSSLIYLFFPSLILYSHFLLTRGVGILGGGVHSTQFTQGSLITSIFLMWLSRSFFHPQKYLSLEIHLMVVLCRRHTKRLGKWEEQIIDKTVGIFSKAEEKKNWPYSFFLRAALVGAPRN